MIRCIRIWTGDDRNSHFEEGVIDLEAGQRRAYAGCADFRAAAEVDPAAFVALGCGRVA